MSETLTDTVHLVNIATYVARRQSIGMRIIRLTDTPCIDTVRTTTSAAVKHTTANDDDGQRPGLPADRFRYLALWPHRY